MQNSNKALYSSLTNWTLTNLMLLVSFWRLKGTPMPLGSLRLRIRSFDFISDENVSWIAFA
jgi:hypothetical protein